MIRKTDCAFLAGLIDGEGSLSISKNNIKWNSRSFLATISLYNNNEKLIKHVQKLFGGCLYSVRIRDLKKHAPSFQIMWRGKKIFLVLSYIRPFLIAKKKQADLMLIFCTKKKGSRSGKRISEKTYKFYLRLVKKLRKLNRRGPR